MRLTASICLMCSSVEAATLQVTDYGAVGDCRDIYVSTTTNSSVIVTTNTFTGGDVGKLAQLFGAGYYSHLTNNGIFAGNYHGTPTNHQDLVVSIQSVGDGTHITLSAVCGVTASNIRCTYGTQNKTAFDNCIAAAASNDVIHIPAGNYHLVAPSALDTNYVQVGQFSALPTITFFKGGLTFLGDGTNSTILTGSGAWQQKGFDAAYRGYLFKLDGPVTNNGPLIFDSIQFNGNATRNHSTLYTGFPAIPTDGSGWDPSHHAVADASSPQPHIYLGYTNCLMTRWHGETLQGIVDGTNGVVDTGNCWFIDGNATVWNYILQHNYHDNLITDYYQVEEGGASVGIGQSYFTRNVVSNDYSAVQFGFNLGDTNSTLMTYNVVSNSFSLGVRNGIATGPFLNLNIVGNAFLGGSVAITIGAAGYQGNSINSNVFIAFNTFTNLQVPVMVDGGGINRSVNVTVVSNSASISEAFGEDTGLTTNVVFSSNVANKGVDSTVASGQYILDDLSNSFPYRMVPGSSATNRVGYEFGARQRLYSPTPGRNYYLDDAVPAKIPPGAQMAINNIGQPATLYSSSSLTNPVVVPTGFFSTATWTGTEWTFTTPAPPAPTDLRVVNLNLGNLIQSPN